MKKVEWFILGIAVLFIVLITVVITVNVTIKHQTESVAPAAAEEPVPAVEPAVEEEIPAATPVVADEPAPAVETPSAEEPVPAVEPAVEEDSYTDVLDHYGMYKVPEEWAAERGGLFVERETGIYTLNNEVPRYNLDTYGVGFSYNSSSTEDVLLYVYDTEQMPNNIPTDNRKGIVASGDFPIMQVSKGEELHYYGEAENSLKFYKIDFYGYTIPACYCGMPISFSPIIDHVRYNEMHGDNIGIFDMDEDPVVDVRNLDYGEDYKYEWYEGTKYNELQYTANCRCYTKDTSNMYKVPGTLTKFGYVAFDISDLEPGFYTRGHAVFEITE